MSSDDLNPRQAAFVQEYLKDLNASQACVRAGYSAKGANVTGSQLLANPSIAAAVQKGMALRAERAQVTQDWVIKRLQQIAGTDMTDLASWNESGIRFKESSELSEGARASVREIEQVMNEHGGTIKVKQYDRISALKLLGQHLGMFKEQLEVNATLTARPLQEMSDEELERSLKDSE